MEMSTCSPRQYQLEIYDHALRQNTLAFLPTGSGKTLISVLLIKYYLNEIVKNVENGLEKQLIVFLAPTKILVSQQEKYLAGNTDHVVCAYTGDTKSLSGSILDHWGVDNWLNELHKVDIMVMTPEIMKNILERNLIPLPRFALFVLDECHHAFGKDPMAAVCRSIHNSELSYRPRILGLTASPLPCKKGSIPQKIAELENITGCKLIAPLNSLEDLNFYVPKPQLYTLRNVVSVDQQSSVGSDEILANPQLLLQSLISPQVFDEFKNNASVMSSVFSSGTSLDPWEHPIPFFYHNYFRIRHGQHLQEILILLNTLRAEISDFPQLSILESTVSKLRIHERGTTTKDIPTIFITDLESLIGQLSKIFCDCGLIPGLHGYLSALTSSTKDTVKQHSELKCHKKDVIEHGYIWRNDNDLLFGHQSLAPSTFSMTRMKRERNRHFEVMLTTSCIDMSKYEAIVGELMSGPFHSPEKVTSNPLELLLVTIFDLIAFFVFSVDSSCALKASVHYSGYFDFNSLDCSKLQWPFYIHKLFQLRCSKPKNFTLYSGSGGILAELLEENIQPNDIIGGVKDLIENSTHVCRAILDTFCADELIKIITNSPNLIRDDNPDVVSFQSISIPLALSEKFYKEVSLSSPPVCLPDGHFGTLDPSEDVKYVPVDIYLNRQQTSVVSLHTVSYPYFSLVAPRVGLMLRDLFSQRADTWGNLVTFSDCNFPTHQGQVEDSPDKDVPYENDWAAIIFCRMKLTVLALCTFTESLMSKIAHSKLKLESTSNPISKGSPKKCEFAIRCSSVMGGYHINSQVRKLLDFKAGSFNVLYTTDIAEEGLDVRSCQRVINFDLPGTVKSYVQRRGRARARNSVMINLIPEDKSGEAIFEELIFLLKQEEEMNEYDSSNSGKLSNTVADFFKCMTNEHDLRDSPNGHDYIDPCNLSVPPDGDHQMYRYVVPQTGVVVDVNNATQLLLHYCHHIPHDRYYKLDPIYWITTHKAYTFGSSSSDPIATALYQCSILLPQQSPPQVRCLIGPLVSSKLLSKSLVSLECIKKLHVHGELDDYLQSTNSRTSIQRKKDQLQNSKLREEDLQEISTNMKEDNNPETIIPVDIKITPTILDCNSDFDPTLTVLYLYAFQTDCKNNCHEKYVADCPTCSRYVRSMSHYGLIFRQPIPEDILDDTMDFYIRGIKIDVKMGYIGSKFVSLAELNYLQLFHRHILCWEDSTDQHIDQSNGWKSNSQSAWYLLFPLGVGLPPHSQFRMSRQYASEIDLILSDDWENYLATCCKETEILVRNLFTHHRQTTVQHSTDTSPEYELYFDQQPKDLYDKVFSRGGYGNIYIGCQSDPNDEKYFDDIMKKIVDDDSQDPQILTFQDHCLLKGQITPSQIVELKTYSQRTSLPLIKSASLAGRLSLVQLLDQVVTSSNIIEEQHSHSAITYLLPQHCKIIGEVKWMMIGLVAPSMIWRIQSLLLAVEAREKITLLMPPCESLLSIQSCPSLDECMKLETSSSHKYNLPKPSLMLKALTPRMTQEILDSERLEFIGDVILKYVVSWILFCRHWKKHEGYLTRARVEIISNAFITKRCRQINFLQYLRAHTLSSGKQELYFAPPGRLLNSTMNNYDVNTLETDEIQSFSLWNVNILKPVTKIIDNRIHHNSSHGLQYATSDVKAKRIADMLEALIGAFYESGGINCAIGVIRAFGLWPSMNAEETIYPLPSTTPSPDDNLPIIPPDYPIELSRVALGRMTTSSSFTSFGSENLSNLSITRHTARLIHFKLGYNFQHLSLLDEALTHCSIISKQSNQRLEYLGDAVLDYVTMAILYELLPTSSQGQLSTLKSQFLCNFNLTKIVIKYELYHHLQVMSTALMNQLNEIEIWLRGAKDKATAVREGMENTDKVQQDMETEDNKFTPNTLLDDQEYEEIAKKFDGKFLADMLESLIGAVFIDSHCSTDVIRQLIQHLEIIPKSYFLHKDEG